VDELPPSYQARFYAIDHASLHNFTPKRGSSTFLETPKRGSSTFLETPKRGSSTFLETPKRGSRTFLETPKRETEKTETRTFIRLCYQSTLITH
jgi:hypothetical protein